MTESVIGLKGILFDFGGTLDGPGLPWVDRFAIAYGEAGIEVPDARLRDATGYGTRQAYRTSQVSGFDLQETVAFHVTCQFTRLQIENPRAADRIVAAFVARSTAALAESRATLERLAGRFKLGVVSNFYGNMDRILTDAGIAPLLATIVDSTVVGVCKPDPGIFVLALARLEVSPAQALFVGDSLGQDIIPARAAGLRTAHLVRAPEGLDASPADLRVRTLPELESLLAG